MLQTLAFRINVPTALDFLLHYAHKSLETHEAQAMVFKAIPWVYFIEMNYNLSRHVRPSAIAMAALSFAI
jgi:hypothetical protein